MMLPLNIILLLLCASSRCNAFTTPWHLRNAQKQQQCVSQRTTLFGHDAESPDDNRLEVRNSQKEQLAKALSRTMEEIEIIVACNPNLLRSIVKKSIAPKVALLQKRLGFTRKEAGRVASTLKAVRMLTNSIDLLETKIDWIMSELQLNKSQMRSLVKASSGAILASSLESHVAPKVELLREFVGLDNKQIVKVLSSPYVYKKISPEHMRHRLTLLREIFGIDETDVATLQKYVLRHVEILFLKEEDIVERYNWMRERLKSSKYTTAQIIKKQGKPLAISIESMENMVDWLQKALNLTHDEVAAFVAKFPSIFCYNIEERLELKLRYLRERFGLDDEHLKDLLLRMPGLFSYSDEKIEEKLQFYSTLVGEEKAKIMVVESPNLIVTASLENRLQPRLAEVQKSEKKVKWDKVLIQRLARRYDDAWDKYGIGDAPRGRAKKAQ